MSEKVFKKGDRVKCVDSDGTALLSGSVYTVAHIYSYSITLEEVKGFGGYYNYRFELVDSAEVTRVPKTRAEEIAELEAKLATLRSEEKADRVKAAVEERCKLVEDICTTIKSKIDQNNYYAPWYKLNVNGHAVDLTIGECDPEE